MATIGSSTDVKQVDVKELFNLLESNDTQVVNDIKMLIHENLQSTRESWLLQSLVDYYFVAHSERAMEILAGIREPHDKHLFDKLNEGLKLPEQRLLALRLLLFMICKQPSWIHKLVQQPLFNSIIKHLKNDQDIPTLMTAVLVITNYLPVEPTSIALHLSELFEIFTRLLAFSMKKPGNIPDIFLLHLQVAVYALFHRLYGMFPCNFLAYLRHHFMKREHREVYEEILKPMIERVRLHPLLITGSKDFEATAQRWRKKEIHDIVVDCAKMSLDMIEGTWEEVRCPIAVPRRQQLYRRMVPHHTSTPATEARTAAAGSAHMPGTVTNQPEQSPPFYTAAMTDPNILWSPTAICGLSTPPPNHHTPQIPGQADPSLQHSYAGTSYANTPFLTPSQTPRATPPVIVDDLFERSVSSRNNSKTSITKRLSGSLSSPKLHFSMTNVAHTSFDSPASLSVPPSPLRPEFTSEPPIGTHRTQPLPKAAQKLPFDDIPETERRNSSSSAGASSLSYNWAQRLDSSFIEKFRSCSGETSSLSGAVSDRVGVPTEATSATGLVSPRKLDAGPPPKSDLTTIVDTNGAMSIQVVDQVVLEFIEGNQDRDDTDEEVCGINRSTDESGKLSRSESADRISSSLQLTAQSVQSFMRKVNRIRFNSLTIGNSMDVLTEMGTRTGTRTRSLSCPQLQKVVPSHEAVCDDPTVRCSSAAARRSFAFASSSSTMSASNCLGEQESCDCRIPPTIIQSNITTYPHVKNNVSSHSIINSAAPSASHSGDSVYNVDIASSQNLLGGSTSGDNYPRLTHVPLTKSEIEDNAAIEQILPRPFDRILQYSLPYSAITRCQRCKTRYVAAMEKANLNAGTAKKPDYEAPLFSTFSPPELLDRHLQLGSEVHAKELSRIPITSHDSINWTHFGGLPPADEINILRGQILLIQNQLMYERHKRELHAKRNRRLLSKITHAKSLEEQNSALLDQLRLQENEIQSLQVSIKLLQQENQQYKNSRESDTYETQVQLRMRVEENEELKYARSDLATDVRKLQEEKRDIMKKLQQTEYQLFNAEKEVQTSLGQVAIAAELHNQVSRLNKELLLMGELQQKYQEQLAAKLNNNRKPDHEHLVMSLKADLKAMKSQAEQKQAQVCGQQKKILELEDLLKNKDMTLADLKRNFEMVKTSHQEEIKAVESKYRSSIKIGQQLESQIMDLYSQIETIKRAARQRGSVKVASEMDMGGHLRPGPAYKAQSETRTLPTTGRRLELTRERAISEPCESQSLPNVTGPVNFPVLSQQLLSASSLAGQSAPTSLLGQSDAFSQKKSSLAQSTDAEAVSPSPQSINMDKRCSPEPQRTNVSDKRTDVIGSQAGQSQDSDELDTDIERHSASSSRSNTLCDSGVETR